MNSAVLLSVLLLVITNTKVLARPSDIGLKTKRSIEEFKPKQIKLPTEMREGFELVINGSIDVKAVETFVTTLKAGDKEDDHCKITFHLENRTVVVTQAEETSSVDLTPDVKADYKDYPMFSLTIMVDKGFNIMPEYDGVIQPTEIIKCSKTNYNDFGHIEFSEGLHHINSLSFKFGATPI